MLNFLWSNLTSDPLCTPWVWARMGLQAYQPWNPTSHPYQPWNPTSHQHSLGNLTACCSRFALGTTVSPYAVELHNEQASKLTTTASCCCVLTGNWSGWAYLAPLMLVHCLSRTNHAPANRTPDHARTPCGRRVILLSLSACGRSAWGPGHVIVPCQCSMACLVAWLWRSVAAW